MQIRNRVMFGRNSLATAISMVILGSTQVQAQNAAGMEEVLILGSRGALVSALEKQREANKVSGVVDSDAIGTFADINVAESLRRISGVMVENDQGEGRYVSVRGMSSDLNAMTINGVSMASPEARRGVMLDGVPSEMLDSMTVYKTLTPDMDADTIGGAIDLETLSAFRYDGFHARIKAETSYNDLTEDSNNPNLSATVTNIFEMSEGDLGVALVLSDQNRRIISYNNETGGYGIEAPDDDYELRYYDIDRERQGAVLNLDYRADNGSLFYAHLLHNDYKETEERAKWETRDGLEDNEAVISGDTFTYANTRVDTESRPRVEIRQMSAIQLGTEFEMANGIGVKMELFGSEAKQDDTDKWNVIYRSGSVDEPLVWDNSDPKKPVLNFAPDFYDPSNFELNTFEYEYALTTDQDMGFRVDLNQALTASTELQYGIKYRQREKRNDFNFCGYDPLNEILLSDTDIKDIAPYFNTVHGPAPSSENGRSYISLLGQGSYALSDGTTCFNPGDSFEVSGDEDEESIAADWYTDEDVLATYLMATTMTERITWVYGLRYEDTRTEYRGKVFDGDAFAGNTAFKNDYGFLAPSLNMKYEVAENQIARLGVFRSLIRPGFNESRAGAEIDVEDNEISGGNPGLDPTTAWNFDLGYEWYVDQETFIGGGIFFKSLNDPIVEVETFNTNFRDSNWSSVETYINTEDTELYGFELSMQTAMQNGLVLTFNYTRTEGDNDLPADATGGQRTVPYFKQAKNTANASIGYDKGPWDIRLAGNYRSEYLDALGNDALRDRYTDSHFQLDLTGRYTVNDNLTLTASAINLNDRPEYYYFGNRNRLSQYDEFGATYTLGLRYQF